MAKAKRRRYLGKAARLRVFQQRLSTAIPARSFDEAYGQICRILNQVEDEFHNRPFNPSNAMTDKRLYPPLWDNIFPEPKRPNVHPNRPNGKILKACTAKR
jgi:hypothetical protein